MNEAKITDPYLIKKRDLYYRDDCCGYTQEAEMAGIYTKEFAMNHCDPSEGIRALRAIHVMSEERVQHCIDKLTIIRDAHQIRKSENRNDSPS